MNILLISEYPESLEGVKQVLSKHIVTIVSSTVAGLKILLTPEIGPIDLVIAQTCMSYGANGWDFLKTVKEKNLNVKVGFFLFFLSRGRTCFISSSRSRCSLFYRNTFQCRKNCKGN